MRIPSKMNVMQNQRGSALLVVLIVVVVLSIMGGVMLSIITTDNKLTASVVTKTRAEMLAQMGLDETESLIREAVARAERAVDSGAPDVRISRAEQMNLNLQKITDYEDEYLAAGSEGPVGTYAVQINSRMSDQPTADSPDSAYAYTFEITSTGSIGSPYRVQSQKRATIVVSDIAPVFRYVLSTPADGQVTMNGSPSIVGDGLLSRPLLVSPTVNYFDDQTGSRQSISTIPPIWRGFIKTGDSSVKQADILKKLAWPQPYIERVTGDELRAQTFFVGTTPPAGSDERTGDNGIVGQKIQLAKNLVGTQQKVSTDGLGTDIGLGSQKRTGCEATCGADRLIGNNQFLEDLTIQGNADTDTDTDLIIDGDLIVNNPQTNGSIFFMEGQPRVVVREGTIYARNDDRNTSAAFLNGEIVMLDRNGNVSRQAEIIIEGNATLSNFEYSGSMYVQGDVKIIGNLKMNGILYVTGNVDLKNMLNINPPDEEGRNLGNPLVIAANGSMALSSNRSGETLSKAADARKIRAFLYSNQEINLFGVLSSYQIIGGVFAKNVTINAVRGDFSSVPLPGMQAASRNYYFENQSDSRFLRNESPRLQLLYDPQLFSNPPYGIPWTERVNVFVTKREGG